MKYFEVECAKPPSLCLISTSVIDSSQPIFSCEASFLSLSSMASKCNRYGLYRWVEDSMNKQLWPWYLLFDQIQFSDLRWGFMAWFSFPDHVKDSLIGESRDNLRVWKDRSKRWWMINQALVKKVSSSSGTANLSNNLLWLLVETWFFDLSKRMMIWRWLTDEL